MFIVTGILVALVSILIVIVRKYGRNNTKLPPGPKGFIFGNNAYQIDAHRPHIQLTEWAKSYRDLYKIRIHGEDIIVLCSSELIRHAAVSNADAFAGRPAFTHSSTSSSYPSSPGQTQEERRPLTFCLSRCDLAPHWMRMKKVVVNALKMHGEGLARLEEITLEESGTLLERFSRLDGQQHDPWTDLKRSVATIMFNLTFGIGYSAEEVDAHLALEKAIHDAWPPGGATLEPDTTQWMGFSTKTSVGRRRNHRFRNRNLDDELYRAYKKPLQYRKGHVFSERFTGVEHAGCLADALLVHNMYCNVQDVLSDEDICTILRDIDEAALAPLTATLYSILGLLVEHPDHQQQLYQQITDVIGTDQPKLSDRKKLPYAEAVILETFRFTSQLPLGLPHKTTKAVNMNGYIIPQGVQVILNLWSLHHDERYWEDPWHFVPERFLTIEGAIISTEHPSRRRLLPFGAGRRACVGEMVAKNRLFLLLTSIVQRFELQPSNDDRGQGHQPPIIIDPHNFRDGGIGIRPQNFKMRFVERNTCED